MVRFAQVAGSISVEKSGPTNNNYLIMYLTSGSISPRHGSVSKYCMCRSLKSDRLLISYRAEDNSPREAHNRLFRLLLYGSASSSIMDSGDF